jgi:hypothetical protein
MIEETLVLVVGSIVGAIITTQLWQMNWFKKENFKIKRDNLKAENRIKIKKLERELGLQTKKAVQNQEKTGILGQIGDLASIAKELDPDQLRGLVDLALGHGEEGEGSDIMDLLNNPAVQGIIQGIGKNKKTGSEDKNIYY